MIAVVDYGLGNLASVRNAFRAAGAEVEVSSDPAVIRRASGVVVPGVGAASAGMEQLRSRRLDGVVLDVAKSGRPLLGICLGMQLLFEHSEEGNADCLGLIPGGVRLLRGAEKVPHIGWNQVATQSQTALWSALPSAPYFYFVHSYVCDPADKSACAGTTDYGGAFCSAVSYGSVWGTQFHPERSGDMGLQVIKNFAARCDSEYMDVAPSSYRKF
jgi:imidazole glycerol-phosphate synthase subunit HisH